MTFTPKPSSNTQAQNANSIPCDRELQARDYIIEMLAELCELAQKNKQEDILPFLNLSYQAIINCE